ncbi:cullin family domain-containing protein [Ditylenchus destructor]|uniref:Cullin-5 n=1 Tax=Ditylenchus destructor TaxID=166010 RepID=A0AAD4NI97_9BILA|nr:cullin family domain-containing protein [Ditylenchus destructor]
MNLRPRTVNFDEVWGTLRNTVEGIVKLQEVKKRTWDDNFSDIYFVCVSIPEAQHQRLYSALQECLINHTKLVLEHLRSVKPESLLREYNKEWHKFHKGAIYLQNLFGYLNRHLAKEKIDAESQHIFLPVEKDPSTICKSVGNLAHDVWKSDLINPLANTLVPFIIDSIEKDRTGNADVADIHGAILSFVEVNETFDGENSNGYNDRPSYYNPPTLPTDYYQDIFEQRFLNASTNYYKYLTSDAYANLGSSEYMEKVIQKLEEERQMCRKFLHTSSLEKIEKLCSEYLVNAQIERFNSVCKNMVQSEELKDLHNMYILLRPLHGRLNMLVKEFEEHTRKEGMDLIVAAGTEPAQFVASIQKLHQKFTKIVTKVFDDDGEFTAALDRALQHMVNYREEPRQPPKVAERLNRYIDGLLRKSAKGMSESEIDTCLTNAITIFRYIDDKDLFQKYYSKFLSNRLLFNLSYSMDLEESMIGKMKEACGYEFTNKLSRMFTDIGTSKNLTEKFNEEISKKGIKLEIPISVMVLQAGAWPLSATAKYSPPGMLQESLKHFECFYSTHHNGRKLSWLYNNSVAEVRLNYLKTGQENRAYLVVMNVYQLAILMVFSNQNTAGVPHIAQQTGLSTQTVLRCLKGVTDVGLLTIQEGLLDEMSVLNLNLNFVSRKLRFKIVAPQAGKPQEKEADATCNTVQQDRKYYMECTIVRIMKARKVMKHGGLIDEVIKQTTSRFVPDVNFIKKNIEALIEKLYIQRTDQHDEYQYLA